VRRNWPLCLALLAAIAGLLYGITAGGLWAPYEVTFAEQARRIAVNLLGGRKLVLALADNSLPIRADLGRGELPFTSVALGFRVLGLSAWAGRLPLLAWALAALLTLYGALARLGDRKLGLYTVVVLATTPIFFLQARTLLGDAATLASFAIAWSGCTVACLSDEATLRVRGAYALLGAIGAYAGFWCRGPVVGVAVPLLAAGVTGLLHVSRLAPARFATLGCLVVGSLGLVLGVSGLLVAEKSGQYSALVGSALVTPALLPTFDLSLGDLAHGAFPWSAAAPLGLALLFEPGGARSERVTLHSAALGLGMSLLSVSWLRSSVGAMVLPGVGCFAVLVAAALRALESGRLGSPLLGLTTAALAILIGFDLRESPEKTLTGFGLAGVELPESLQASAGWLWLVGGGGLAVVSLFCLFEGDGARGPRVFRREDYAGVLTALKEAYGGNLVFAWLLVEAALVGFLLLCALSDRVIALPQLESFGSFSRKLAWLGALGVPLTPLGVLAALALRDVTRWSFGGARPSRAQGLLLAFAALGGAASLGLYPALSRQLSPTQAFEAFRKLRRPGERLGVVGELGGAARYEGVPDAEGFDQSDVAFEWLTESASARRFLTLRKTDLAELNAQYRALRHRNLPILDARSSEVLLGSNLLGKGERSQNPLDPLVLEAPPPLQHRLDAVLADQLEVLGWSLRSSSGELETSVTPGRTYQLAVVYRVLAPLAEHGWQAFVHVDGFQRRFNADHQPLAGRYPLRLWRPGDVLVDTAELQLEPNFSPGSYHLYLGLFCGDRRLNVSHGPENEDRVAAGVLQVR
jgi:hypothetical protein